MHVRARAGQSWPVAYSCFRYFTTSAAPAARRPSPRASARSSLRAATGTRGFRSEQGESRIGQAGIQQQAHEGRLGPGLGRNPQHVVALFQFVQRAGLQFVAFQMCRQLQFQFAAAGVDDRRGEGAGLAFARPEQALAVPGGLAQADAVAVGETRQGQAQGLDEILVADDPYAPADLGRGQVFQAWARCLDEDLAAAYAFDGLQVDRLQGGVADPHQALEDRVGFRLVFLDRAGQRAARQIDQGVQGGPACHQTLGSGRRNGWNGSSRAAARSRSSRPSLRAAPRRRRLASAERRPVKVLLLRELELMIDGGLLGLGDRRGKGREGRRRSVH